LNGRAASATAVLREDFTPKMLVDLLTCAGLGEHAEDDLPKLIKVLTEHRARFAEALLELDLSSVELLPPFDPRWE